MKRLLVKSVHDTFDYVMDHYYPPELEGMAIRKDTYAIISIQDTHTDGFGIEFKKNHFCKDVLTLYFDDVVREVDGMTLFTEEMAHDIIEFVKKNRKVETMIVHCYAGKSRSRAVAASIAKHLGGNCEKYFQTGVPNRFIFDTMEEAWKRAKEV